MSQRTYTCKDGVIDRLRKERGLSSEQLAERAEIHSRTLRRLAAGKPAYLVTIAGLARALEVPVSQLLHGQVTVPAIAEAPKSAYTLSLSLSGLVPHENSLPLLEAVRRFTEELAATGAGVTKLQSAMHLTDPLQVTIVLVYGVLIDGGPCWIYAAVRPDKYADFMKAYNDGSLNMHAFDEYGELIVSGTGKLPPDSVTQKVADLYSTSLELRESGGTTS
jgi:transcriptional regulator with XRE-family HTH domain